MIFGEITRVSHVFRDGPFDIQGVVIFPCNKLFFFSFWTTSYLKKTATSFKIFFLNNTLKSEKYKRKQQTE